MNRHFPFIILFAVLLSLCPRALAAAGDAPVRVGVYDNGAFMSRDASGQYVGFCMEYLQHLFSLAGRQFVRVESGSWANALAMLERGELDVLPSVYRTPQMEKRVLFPRLPMCTLYMTLMVRQNDERYGYEDHRAFQGMRVGVLRGSRDSELFANYCAGHGIAPVVAAYDDISSLLHDLEAGTLDGVALTHPGRRNTFRCVARFAPEPVYMAVSARHPDLLASLDAAMDNSVMEDPSYGIRLFRKYFAASGVRSSTRSTIPHGRRLSTPIRKQANSPASRRTCWPRSPRSAVCPSGSGPSPSRRRCGRSGRAGRTSCAP